MNSKKILIVTYGFHPVQSPRSFRATELAVELSLQGHEVTILGPNKEGIEDFLLEHGLQYISYGDITWRVPQLKGSSRLAHLFNRAIVRGLGLLMEYPAIQLVFLVRKKLKQLSGFDGLISIAVPYPLHWAVASIWKKEKDKNPAWVWIADCGDPYCGRENDTFKVPFYFAWVEKWFMNKADYITVPTESAVKGYFKQFHQKIEVIPQGFRFKEYKSELRSDDDKVYFIYGGGFLPNKREPKELLNFLTEVSNEFDFQFDIYTKSPELVRPYITNSENIRLLNQISRDEFMKTASSYDFLVNFSNMGTIQTPSKLIDYGLLKKPVLNIETGNLDRDNVLKFLSKDYSKRMIIEDIENFNIEIISKKFLKLVNLKLI
jgi:hypothetical protein